MKEIVKAVCFGLFGLTFVASSVDACDTPGGSVKACSIPSEMEGPVAGTVEMSQSTFQTLNTSSTAAGHGRIGRGIKLLPPFTDGNITGRMLRRGVLWFRLQYQNESAALFMTAGEPTERDISMTLGHNHPPFVFGNQLNGVRFWIVDGNGEAHVFDDNSIAVSVVRSIIASAMR